MSDAAERYFAVETPAQRAPGAAGRYLEIDSVSVISFLDGLEFRAVAGEHALVSFATYAPNTVVPRHAHLEEQFTFVLEGELEFDLDGEVRVLTPGTVAHIPPHVPHAARTRERGCRQVDVFSPPRRVLLEQMTDGDA